MKILKFNTISLLSLIVLFIFSGCESDDGNTKIDSLTEVGLIGTWQLETRIINNVSDPSIPCCQTIEFSTDTNPDDMIGLFSATDVGSVKTGDFELKNQNEIIEFRFGDDILTYDISISNTITSFSYTENGHSIKEDWRLQNE